MGKEEPKEEKDEDRGSEPSGDNGTVPLYLPILEKHTASYPNLVLDKYKFKKDSHCSNVLALVHNMMKREVADLLTAVIPSLEHETQHSIGNSMGERWENIHKDITTWWKVFLRLLFFVSEQDVAIVDMVVESGCKYLKSVENMKQVNTLQRKRKTVSDCYSYSTEIVIRAADRALDAIEHAGTKNQINKLIEKLSQVIHFILDTMQMVTEVVKEVEGSVPDYKIAGLESSVAAKLGAFAKEDKAVFMYTFARWMNDNDCIKRWITKHGGWRAKSQVKTWEKQHTEGRGAIIDRLLS